MDSLVHDQVVTAALLWVRLVVSRELGIALAALEEAGAGLVPLAADTDWQSEGFRALSERLDRLSDDTGLEVGRVKSREWELTAGGAE